MTRPQRIISEDDHLAIQAFAENAPRRDPRLLTAIVISDYFLKISLVHFTSWLVHANNLNAELLSRTLDEMCTFHEEIYATFSDEYLRVYMHIDRALDHYKRAARQHELET